MNSSKGEKFLGAPGIKQSINDLLSEGADPKVRDLVQYENAIRLSDISYNEGYVDGVEFERTKENPDTYILSQFKKISVHGLPESYAPGKKRSRTCVIYIPPEKPGEGDGKYLLAWYSYEKECWRSALGQCLGEEVYGKLEPTKYLELPELHKQAKQYDVHLQTKSTNCFPEIPDGIYEGLMGGRVMLVKYLGKEYNFTFLKGTPAPGINLPKTVTIIDGYAWALLLDGPIVPNFIDHRSKK